MSKEARVARALNELCSARFNTKDQAALSEFVESYFVPAEDPPSKYENITIHEL